MLTRKMIHKIFGLTISLLMVLMTLQCGGKTAVPADLPKDILGISVGMENEKAETHLKEIGKLIREEKGRQQVWVLKDDLQYGHLAVGYNKENRVQYVTAIAKPNGGTAVKPDQIGSLNTAKQEVNGPNYRYLWEVAARENNPEYLITVQGNQPESIALYTMEAVGSKDSEEEEEEREREKEKKGAEKETETERKKETRK